MHINGAASMKKLLLASAVISSWLMAFTLSLDVLVIVAFTSGLSVTTLPIKAFSATRLGVSAEIKVFNAIVIGIVPVGVITAWLISKCGLVRRQFDENVEVQTV